MSEIIYCSNDGCEAPATKAYIAENGVPMYLCDSCAEIFELGQANPDVNLIPVENLEEDDTPVLVRVEYGAAGIADVLVIPPFSDSRVDEAFKTQTGKEPYLITGWQELECQCGDWAMKMANTGEPVCDACYRRNYAPNDKSDPPRIGDYR